MVDPMLPKVSPSDRGRERNDGVSFRLLSCGCVRRSPANEFESCLVHDITGRRWDSYTGEDVAARERQLIDVQTEATQWSCYCPVHEGLSDSLMPVGTKCVWVKTSYEYDEWDCHCLESWRQDWVDVVTTDWYALVMKDVDEARS